jgi:hypothetical protein
MPKKLTQVKKGDSVCVKWLDIKAALHTDEQILPAHAITLGWVDASNPTWIRISTTKYVGELDELSDKIVIPRGCIENIKQIKL